MNNLVIDKQNFGSILNKFYDLIHWGNEKIVINYEIIENTQILEKQNFIDFWKEWVSASEVLSYLKLQK